MNWYLKAMKKYATFSGRSQRAEFWYFMLFYFIGIFIASFIDVMMGTVNEKTGWGPLGIIFLLIHFLPQIALVVRRLHDTGRSGWWFILTIVPLIGVILLIIYGLIDSKEDNKYGKNPKKELI